MNAALESFPTLFAEDITNKKLIAELQKRVAELEHAVNQLRVGNQPPIFPPESPPKLPCWRF